MGISSEHWGSLRDLPTPHTREERENKSPTEQGYNFFITNYSVQYCFHTNVPSRNFKIYTSNFFLCTFQNIFILATLQIFVYNFTSLLRHMLGPKLGLFMCPHLYNFFQKLWKGPISKREWHEKKILMCCNLIWLNK